MEVNKGWSALTLSDVYNLYINYIGQDKTRKGVNKTQSGFFGDVQVYLYKLSVVFGRYHLKRRVGIGDHKCFG